NVAMGDVQRGTTEYQTIFAVGTVLFLLTFILNIIAKKVVKKGKELQNV
ncbi:MAG TPA: phosphate ABC transporter permease subunit PstC, partial [Clostridium sp.]|nr:phosphate ABC transporter permease subunit PstC [Clostridium sp.]